jgi:hypothetical protein
MDVDLRIEFTKNSNFFVPLQNCSDVDQWRNDYSAQNDLIVGAVRTWLEGGDSRIGSQFCNGGLQFEIIFRGRGFPGIQFIGFSRCVFVNPAPLRRKLKEKVEHYRDLATQNNIPLLVAVVADIRTGYDREEFENVLFGHIVHDVAEDKANGSWQVQGVRRERDSLFDEEPVLSGAIWVSRRDVTWAMNGYANPTACRPLPPELVTAICSK